MEHVTWIGKTDTPRLDWGADGDRASAIMEAAKDSIIPEGNSILFRKEYVVDKAVARATLRVCGLGLYEFYVDGDKIGDYVLSPIETHYRKVIYYDEFDITDRLTVGRHCFGAEVGNGRYSTPKKYWDWRSAWYGDPCLTAVVTVTYEDGRTDVWSTDDTWKCRYGALYANCFYDGEGYDANNDCDGWKTVDYDDADWDGALIVAEPGGTMKKNEYIHLKKIRSIKPIKVYEKENGAVTYRFAENIPGWVGVTVEGGKGDEITIRYAEREENGELDVTSNERACNTDRYRLKDGGRQYYEPKFTLRGFSAVEITLSDPSVRIVDVTAFVVHSDLQQTGEFRCDNSDINRLHDVILRTQKAALLSYPVDCPQRDERLGWGADAHVTARTCLYNFDMKRYYEKWLDDLRLCRHSEEKSISFIAPWHTCGHAIDWSAAYPIVLWEHYLFYRDRSLIEKHIDTLLDYVGYLEQQGLLHGRTRYGDWLSVHEGWKRGDPDSCSSMFFYYDLQLLVEMLNVLGRSDEAERYIALAERVREAILEKFFDPQALVFDDNSQFCLAFALKLGLIPSAYRCAMQKRLVEDIRRRGYHMAVGMLGAQYLCEVLSDCAPDVLMKLILQKTYPSWLHLIENKTTLSENWDGSRSQNHCLFGSVDAIFYRTILGINVGKTVTVSPYFAEEINHANGSVAVNGGSVSVAWVRENGVVQLRIDIAGVEVTYGQDRLTDGTHTYRIS